LLMGFVASFLLLASARGQHSLWQFLHGVEERQQQRWKDLSYGEDALPAESGQPSTETRDQSP